MSLTKDKAWVIFRADKLGHEEYQSALDRMSIAELNDYFSHAEDFDFEIAKIGVEAQNEAAGILDTYPGRHVLDTKKQYLWDAIDYTGLVSMFKGSKFETLHLSAMFGVPNNELLLELVKP